MNIRVAPLVLGVIVIASGCAGPMSDAQRSFREGRYADARGQYEDILSRDPARLDALVGLGISHYRLNEFAEANTALSQALDRQPRSTLARLYRGLAALQTGDDGRVDEDLGALREGADPRFAAHVDRTLRALRGEPVSPEMRAYMAASLEDEASLVRELADARQALRESEFRRLTDERVIYRVPRNCRCS